MNFSILQEVLMPISFGALLCLMLLYWGQAALFSYTRYSKLTTVLFSFSFFLLTTLIILRWLDSGHFPLSNLYESLLFLSWSFLGIQLVAQLTLIRGVQEPALAVYAKPSDIACQPPAWSSKAGKGSTRRAKSAQPHSAKITLAQPTHAIAESAIRREAPMSTSVSNFFSTAPGADRLIASDIEHAPRSVMADFALRELSQRQLLHLLGVITSPMALLTYGFAFLKLPREMQKATALVPALQSNWLMMHVTIMILSYAALLCGSIFSMAFLLLTSINTSSPANSSVRLQTVTGTSPAVGVVPTSNTQTTSASALHTAAHQHGSLGADKPLPAAAYLRVEPSAGVIPRPTWPELPKICFSDRLELHDWAQRAPTRLGRAAGRTLDVAAAKASLLQELRRRPATSTTRLTQAGSALNRQDFELLNNKGQFVGGGLINLLPERTAPAARLWRARQTEGLAQAGSDLSRRDLGVPELEENLEKKSSYLDLAERLDNYSYRVLALGFPLLTVGILSGAVWANEAWGSYWSWDPKETWALITWLVFAIYLHARILKGWTGRKPAMIATFGFFVVWFCYLGVNLLGTGLHSYGWFSN